MRRLALAGLMLLAGCDSGPDGAVELTISAPAQMQATLGAFNIFGTQEQTCAVPFTVTASRDGDHITWVNASLEHWNASDGRLVTTADYPLQSMIDAFGSSQLNGGASVTSTISKSGYADFRMRMILRFQQISEEINTAEFTTLCRR